MFVRPTAASNVDGVSAVDVNQMTPHDSYVARGCCMVSGGVVVSRVQHAPRSNGQRSKLQAAATASRNQVFYMFML